MLCDKETKFQAFNNNISGEVFRSSVLQLLPGSSPITAGKANDWILALLELVTFKSNIFSVDTRGQTPSGHQDTNGQFSGTDEQ